MNIVLSNPPYRIPLGDGRERFFIRAGSRWPFSIVKCEDDVSDYLPFPFYLAYAAALIEREPGLEVMVEDGVALNEREDEFLRRVCAASPRIFLLESATGTVRHDIELARTIKARCPDTLICFAGFHVTALTEETLELAGDAIDFILLQEYEESFLALARAIRDGTDVSEIAGIAFRRGDTLVRNDSPGLVDVNRLPHPARHLFPANDRPDMNRYWDGFCQYRRAVQMHASRGCPFRCDFCVWNQVMYGQGMYRGRDVADICDEIEEVIDGYGAREIYFDDDTFTGHKKHVMAFCEEMIRRGLQSRTRWSAMADFMITDDEMLRRMRAAGCIGVKFGVESGNEEVLKRIGKPVRLDRLRRNAALCARLGIKTHATFTFGLNGETRASMRDTLDLAKSLDCDSVQFSITTPFPGTRYYEELKRRGDLLAERWEDFDGSNSCVVRFGDMDARDVQEFHAAAGDEWLRSKLRQPGWIWRQLRGQVRAWQGQGFGIVRARLQRVWQTLTKR